MSEVVSDVRTAPHAVTGPHLPVQETDGLVLRIGDLFAISVPTLFGLAIVSSYRAVPEWASVSAALFGVALFGLASRFWASKSDHPVAQLVGNFYIMLTIWVLYSRLNPMIDLVSPVPYDRDLQAIDQFLFGVQPSVWLEQFHHPWLTEIAFICYLAFFFWQLGLGILLYLRKNDDFADYMLRVVMFYMLSYIVYIMVPAIGPRFDLAPEYTRQLEGVYFAESIRQTFIDIPMYRDCFPSGHTGLTLLVLLTAWQKRAYKFFAFMFPFAMMLIFSTVYCRFHYVVDLLCALPFITGVVLLQRSLELAMPQGLVLPLPHKVMAKDRIGA